MQAGPHLLHKFLHCGGVSIVSFDDGLNGAANNWRVREQQVHQEPRVLEYSWRCWACFLQGQAPALEGLSVSGDRSGEDSNAGRTQGFLNGCWSSAWDLQGPPCRLRIGEAGPLSQEFCELLLLSAPSNVEVAVQFETSSHLNSAVGDKSVFLGDVAWLQEHALAQKRSKQGAGRVWRLRPY